MSTFIDIHAIQTVPPSNLNRDDTGSPKTAIYGGVRRARVSSQSWKKAMRDWLGLRDNADLVHGLRTRNLQRLVIEDLAGRDNVFPDKIGEDRDSAILELSKNIVEALGFKFNAKHPERTQYLILVSKRQVRDVIDVVLGRFDPTSTDFNKDDKKEMKDKLNGSNSVDLAAFGRMVADDTDLNVNAAVQVAHALGVDSVQTEFDYFTAVDDLSNEKNDDDQANAGAGMIGNVEYDSATFYRYANIGLPQLEKNLSDDKEYERVAIDSILRSFIESVPSGKQNTFAAQTLPSLVIIEVRDSRPVSYAPAFERPVTSKSSASISEAASERLLDYVRQVDAQYGAPRKRYVLDLTGVFTTGEHVPYNDLSSVVVNDVLPVEDTVTDTVQEISDDPEVDHPDDNSTSEDVNDGYEREEHADSSSPLEEKNTFHSPFDQQ
jgi:CRISPR system Cascade subunit CasC